MITWVVGVAAIAPLLPATEDVEVDGVEPELWRRAVVAAADAESLPRPERRAGELALADAPVGAEPCASEPADGAEPVESANAIGIAAKPEPTPSATANAPTRPT